MLLGVGVLWLRTIFQPPIIAATSSAELPALQSLMGRLLFTAVDRGKETLWSSDLDGFDLQQIRMGEGDLLAAAKSNGGGDLIFATQEKGYRAVWRMSAGQHARQLFFVTSGIPLQFIFSPDDQFMVIEERSGSAIPQHELFLVDLERGIRSRIAQDAIMPIWEPLGRAVAYVQLSRFSEDPTTTSSEGRVMIQRMERDRTLENPIEFEKQTLVLSQTVRGDLSLLVRNENGVQWEQKNWQGEEMMEVMDVKWDAATFPLYCQSALGGWGCLQRENGDPFQGMGWWIGADGAVQGLGSGWNHLGVQEGRLLLAKDAGVFTLEARGNLRLLLSGNWNLPVQR